MSVDSLIQFFRNLTQPISSFRKRIQDNSFTQKTEVSSHFQKLLTKGKRSSRKGFGQKHVFGRIRNQWERYPRICEILKCWWTSLPEHSEMGEIHAASRIETMNNVKEIIIISIFTNSIGPEISVSEVSQSGSNVLRIRNQGRV